MKADQDEGECTNMLCDFLILMATSSGSHFAFTTMMECAVAET